MAHRISSEDHAIGKARQAMCGIAVYAREKEAAQVGAWHVLTLTSLALLSALVFAAPTASAALLSSPAHPVILAAVKDRHADPELEALLPATLGGMALTIESQTGTELTTNSVAFDRFLTDLGKTRADFTLASAYAHGGLKAAVGAWRVRGADPARLLPGFKSAIQASSATPLANAEENLAGRTVTRIGDPGQLAQGPVYVFVRGDALLFVQTPDRVLAEEALGKLPR